MELKQYIYILERNKRVTELKLTQEQYGLIIDTWRKGDLIITKDLNDEPVTVNGTDITSIMSDNQYKGYIDSSSPRNYVRKGIWYSGKREIVRYEPWKAALIEEKKKRELEARKEEELTPEERERVAQRIAEINQDIQKSKNYSSE